MPLDLDLFAQDNSGTKKEGVAYTYKGHDGYGVMAAYLGTEGWCLTTDLKPGSENGQLGFGFLITQVAQLLSYRVPYAGCVIRLEDGQHEEEPRTVPERSWFA